MGRSASSPALLLALILLAPSLLCAAGRAELALRTDARGTGAPEKRRCFCHPDARAEGAAMQGVEAPAAGTVYEVPAALTLDPARAARRRVEADPRPASSPAPEPLTRPPISPV